MCRILRVWKILKGSTCRILRVLEGSGRLNLPCFTCLEGSGKLNVSYFTCLEAQNVNKFLTFARFWEAQGGKHPLGSVVNGGKSG